MTPIAWLYVTNPDDELSAMIVDPEGYTVAYMQAPANTTAARDFPDTLSMVVSAPDMLAALRALAVAVKQFAPLGDEWPELRRAQAAIARASKHAR
jgi:hypothetical protein